MIVFIDDEPNWISTYVDELEAEGITTEQIESVDRAIDVISQKREDIELLVLDIMMPPGEMFKNVQTEGGRTTGLYLYKTIKSEFPEIPLVILTNVGSNNLKEFEGTDIPVFRKPEKTAAEFAEFVKETIRH